ERLEEQLRRQAPGGVTTPEQEQQLAIVTALKRAEDQAREMHDLIQNMARDIEGTFDRLWDGVMQGGVKNFQDCGVLVLEALRDVTSQIGKQLVNALLNAATGTTAAEGGWAGALAKGIVGIAGSALGGSAGAGVSDSSAAGLSGEGALFGAAGGGVFRGLG